MARPRKPAYASMRKVLQAIQECSCGKFTRWIKAGAGQEHANDGQKWLLKYIEMRYNCDCVGRKSPSELYTITKLHPNTVHRTLKFLVSHRILRRRVEKRPGHYVTYALARNRYLRVDIDRLVWPHENRERWRSIMKINKDLNSGLEAYEKFCRRHQRVIDLLQRYGFNRGNLSIPFFMTLVRFVERYGDSEGIDKLVDAYKRLEPRESEAFQRIVASTGTIPSMDSVRRYADYLEKQRTIEFDLRLID